MISILVSGIVSAAFSVLFGVRGRHIALAGLDGLIGYAVFSLAAPLGSVSAMLLGSRAWLVRFLLKVLSV